MCQLAESNPRWFFKKTISSNSFVATGTRSCIIVRIRFIFNLNSFKNFNESNSSIKVSLGHLPLAKDHSKELSWFKFNPLYLLWTKIALKSSQDCFFSKSIPKFRNYRKRFYYQSFFQHFSSCEELIDCQIW